MGCGTAGIAAELADDYELNGYTDWFLPSKDALNALFDAKDLVGGFAVARYWSSTEFGADKAWYQNFTGGGQATGFDKKDLFNVRAVRAF